MKIKISKICWVNKSTERHLLDRAKFNQLDQQYRNIVQALRLASARRKKLRLARDKARFALTSRVRGSREFIVEFDGLGSIKLDGQRAKADHPLVRRAVKLLNGGLKP